MHETVPKLVQGPEQEEARGAHRVDVLHCMSNPPDKLPIVVIWTEPEARCGDGSEGEFEACVTPLTNQCGLLAAQSADPPTYIWWRTRFSRATEAAALRVFRHRLRPVRHGFRYRRNAVEASLARRPGPRRFAGMTTRTLAFPALSLVGAPGFEPGTSCPPDKRANQAAPRPVNR